MDTTTRPSKTRSPKLLLNGVEKTFVEHLLDVGLKESTVRGRIKHMGMSVQEALTYTPERHQIITIDGIRDTVGNHVARKKISPATWYYRRVRRGMSIYDALNSETQLEKRLRLQREELERVKKEEETFMAKRSKNIKRLQKNERPINLEPTILDDQMVDMLKASLLEMGQETRKTRRSGMGTYRYYRLV